MSPSGGGSSASAARRPRTEIKAGTMAVFGMTGFGRAEGVHGATRWSWEARSVNSKGLDVRVRLPHGRDALEIAVRKAVQERFARGSFNLTLQLRADEAAPVEVRVNQDVVRAYLAAMAPFELDGQTDRPRMEGLLTLPGVLASGAAQDEEARAAEDSAVMAGLDQALDALAEARAEEGAALAGVLEDLIGKIGTLVGLAEAEAATQPEAIKARLTETLAKLTDQTFDPARLAQEVALLAGKADVREELDRLAAHVDAARALLSGGSPCGRKLDFLAQEFNREANTLCSKSADLELTRIGLDLKATIEQMREQIQNVE